MLTSSCFGSPRWIRDWSPQRRIEKKFSKGGRIGL